MLWLLNEGGWKGRRVGGLGSIASRVVVDVMLVLVL